jgi:hypothetical protein
VAVSAAVTGASQLGSISSTKSVRVTAMRRLVTGRDFRGWGVIRYQLSFLFLT